MRRACVEGASRALVERKGGRSRQQVWPSRCELSPRRFRYLHPGCRTYMHAAAASVPLTELQLQRHSFQNALAGTRQPRTTNEAAGAHRLHAAVTALRFDPSPPPPWRICSRAWGSWGPAPMATSRRAKVTSCSTSTASPTSSLPPAAATAAVRTHRLQAAAPTAPRCDNRSGERAASSKHGRPRARLCPVDLGAESSRHGDEACGAAHGARTRSWGGARGPPSNPLRGGACAGRWRRSRVQLPA
eukprot:353034-Chlamydomonas_euryale.AAC.7